MFDIYGVSIRVLRQAVLITGVQWSKCGLITTYSHDPLERLTNQYAIEVSP